jgi:hypothetical protein
LLPADSGTQQDDGGGGQPNGLPEFEEFGIIDRHSLQRHSVVTDRGMAHEGWAIDVLDALARPREEAIRIKSVVE